MALPENSNQCQNNEQKTELYKTWDSLLSLNLQFVHSLFIKKVVFCFFFFFKWWSFLKRTQWPHLLSNQCGSFYSGFSLFTLFFFFLNIWMETLKVEWGEVIWEQLWGTWCQEPKVPAWLCLLKTALFMYAAV